MDEDINDDNQEGPFTVWQMFNAPTMVLFNNLEHAADGLERLLTSILKLTGDYSEVLVPRADSPNPIIYYKSFNMWLMGRLFYVWSVEELKRIHEMSKDAQLKILKILSVYGATFFDEIHEQYFEITEKLIDYYNDLGEDVTGKEMKLEYFVSEKLSIPNVQLDLSPIFVNVKDKNLCRRLITLNLQLLKHSISMNSMHIDGNTQKHVKLFEHVLFMLENYDMSLKLISVEFFCDVIQSCNNFAVVGFYEPFQNCFKEFWYLLEAMVAVTPVLYVQGELDTLFLEKLNMKLLTLLKISLNFNNQELKEVSISICKVILDPQHAKFFNKALKMFCMSSTIAFDLPLDITSIQRKDGDEIRKLKESYCRHITEHMMKEKSMPLKDNWHYNQVMKVIDNMKSFEDYNIEKFLINYHLHRCASALQILESVKLQCKHSKMESKSIFSKESSCFVWKWSLKLCTTHRNVLMDNPDYTELLGNIIISTVYLCDEVNLNDVNLILQLLGFQPTPNFSSQSIEYRETVKFQVLRNVLAAHVIMKRKPNDTWNRRLQQILSGLDKKKYTILDEILSLCPLLLLNAVFFESKLISDILMPAFLTKDPKIQEKVVNILPAIACISLGGHLILTNKTDRKIGHTIFTNSNLDISLVCYKCHINNNAETINTIIGEYDVFRKESPKKEYNNSTIAGLRSLFGKFLNCNAYRDLPPSGYLSLVGRFSNHTIVSPSIADDIFKDFKSHEILKVLRTLLDNVAADENIEPPQREAIYKSCVNALVDATENSLENNNAIQQTYTVDCIRDFGLSSNNIVLLPSTKLLVYFIMHPQCPVSDKAVIYLRQVCEAHDSTPNQVYHRYKKDYCRIFVECSLYNGKEFAIALLQVVRAFGFVGYRDFISKDVHHFLPYLIPYTATIEEVPAIIEEIASLVQCSVSDFLIERFPHVYTHVYLYESDQVAKKCYELIERLTKTSTLSLIRRHFRVILTEFLLQYCCNPEKVLNACRYLACNDPDVSTPNCSMTMSTSQIADFLQPKFLGVLAYFDHKLVNVKVALSVKRKALQSFPDIMKLMGVKYLTPLRFKVLATLRSAMSLAAEFPKILAAAWSAFIHNIDSIALGPLLANLAVSLHQQLEYAPHEINKIYQYLVLNNENLLSSHISDLFFLEDTEISEKVKVVISRHVKRTQPESFLDKIKWYMQHLNQDIPMIKAIAFSHLDKLLKDNRDEIHKAIFGGKGIDATIVELINCLLIGCKDPSPRVSLASGACFGQLGAIEAGHLPRQYVPPDRTAFAFAIDDDCFAATALVELTRAFQYEKDTTNMDCYALTIQEILKIYNISPTGSKKEVWDSFPEHMHQIMYPLLSSRYTLAYPSQPKKAHPLFGSPYATTFLEWAHNWAGQLIPLIESESVRSLLRTVHPSMRRDGRTLLLFLPYALLHAIVSGGGDAVRAEIEPVIDLETAAASAERPRYRLLRHVRMTPAVGAPLADEGSLKGKCSKCVYTLLDFLNRWLLEWCHSKPNPTQNENYKAISSFLQRFDKLTIARGNFQCGEHERALQYLEMYMDESSGSGVPGGSRGVEMARGVEMGRAVESRKHDQLPLLAEIYALLDEPDSVAGILSMQRSEPSLKELILAQVVTGRLQDAALCYERLAQEGPLDRHSLQGMIDVYLGLDQPFTAWRLLSARADAGAELAAEPLWRLGRFEELERLVQKPFPPSKQTWGLLMGRILLSFRREEHAAFELGCRDGRAALLAQMDGGARGEGALRSGYQSVLGLHIIKEAEHTEEMLRSLKSQPDGSEQATTGIGRLLAAWRLRAAAAPAHARAAEPLLRLRRILLHSAQELLQHTHPAAARRLRACVGDLWLRSAKLARKAGVFQQAYMYVLNAEEYCPEQLFIEKAKMYWARGQREHAFTSLKRGLDDHFPELDKLTEEQRKICAKAKLLIAKYNDEATSVDVDVNIAYYKEAVDVYKQWEKSLVSLGAYYEKVTSSEAGVNAQTTWARRVHALNCYGKALQHGHKYLYQSMPRMLSIWLDVEAAPTDKTARAALAQMTDVIRTYSERLPLCLYLTAFSQIVSRICHPVKEVYLQLKAIIVKLIIAYPQNTLWMMMSVIKSSYPQRIKRCQDVLASPSLKEPQLLKLIADFTQLAVKLIELCNKPIIGNASSTTVSNLVRTLPRLLADPGFSRIMMPFQEYCKVVLPRSGRASDAPPTDPPVYIAGIEEHISILPSLQKPRKVTLKGSDGKAYIIMLKPRDDLRKDYRLMEFNAVVNRFLQDAPETRRRRLYIRTYSVLPLNEECGLIEWVPNLVGLRPILMHIYKQKGIHTSNRELKGMMCANDDPVEKKRRIFEQRLLPRHPPVFPEWFRRVFADPYGWYQARSAYIRTTAVMSMVGYILGLGDRHGENISFDSCNGDAVHVDFNCLFNKGEAFEWPERVPFRLTHNMTAAMGPLRHEGMYRKSCEAVMHVLRAQTAALMSVIGPFVYDPLVSWGQARAPDVERTNEQAMQHLRHIRQRLNGMVKTKNKQLSLSLSPEGQVEHLIVEATSVHNLCQMYIGWGPFL